MTSERDELSSIIIGHDKWNIMPEVAFAAADAIISAGYGKGGSITGNTPLKVDLTIGERITRLEQGFPEPEWGVKWGDEIRAVPDKARAKFIANVMGVDLYGRAPMGKWMKVVL